MTTPITVFTGYLGSGKTTIILNLIKQLPASYRSVWLKNEFGDAEVDSQMAKESNIEVREILNGCLCCVLVGRLGAALEEIIANYAPDRIIVETSGSAYPAPIAVELHRHPETLRLDGIVTVIDALNFEGYRDKSFTARAQAKYTDLILINKHELTDERHLDRVLDDIYELNLETPKIRTDHGKVDPALVFGLDSRLFETAAEIAMAEKERDPSHHDREVELLQVRSERVFDRVMLEAFLKGLPPEYFFRVKGLVRLADGWFALNYVFGRWNWEPLSKYAGPTKIVMMGKSFADWQERVRIGLGLSPEEISRG